MVYISYEVPDRVHKRLKHLNTERDGEKMFDTFMAALRAGISQLEEEHFGQEDPYGSD